MVSTALIVPFDPYDPANPTNASQLPLRLACLAAVTRQAGHTCEVIDGVGRRYGHRWRFGELWNLHGMEIEEAIDAIPEGTDVIGVSMMFSQTLPPFRDFIAALRKRFPNSWIVLGGEGVSGVADRLLETCPVDAIVLGQGEGPWSEILRARDEGQALPALPNVATRQHAELDARDVRAPDAFADLAALPLPDWTGFAMESYWSEGRSHMAGGQTRYLPIAASRGCPFKCKFCTAATTWSTQRYRPTSAVVAEMVEMKRTWGVDHFSFADLSLTTDIKWFKRFLTELDGANLGITWTVPPGVRAQRLDRETLALAQRTGLIHLQIAPETGSPRVAKWVDKRLTIDSVMATAAAAKSLDLPVCGYMIVGFPEEQLEDFVATLAFAGRLAWMGVDEIAVCVFTALPGSPFFLSQMAKGALELDDEFFSKLAQGNFDLQVSHNPRFTGREVQAMRLHLLLCFYAVSMVRYPDRWLGILARIGKSDKRLKLERTLQYELSGLLHGLRPLASWTSLQLAARTARVALRGDWRDLVKGEAPTRPMVAEAPEEVVAAPSRGALRVLPVRS